jgi:hypothetical protein
MIKSRRMGWVRSENGEKGNLYRIFVGKPQGKKPLERPRRRCDNNIKIDLTDKEEGVVRTDPAQDTYQ